MEINYEERQCGIITLKNKTDRYSGLLKFLYCTDTQIQKVDDMID